MLTLAAKVKNRIERIERVREGLMQTLKDLREKIEALENERARLLNEIEGLRNAAELRITALEGEVGQMREEAKRLREILGNAPKMATSPGSNEKAPVLPSSS